MISPRRIGISERYWSGALLRAWARRRYGPDVTIVQIADALGWSKTATRYALNDTSSPTLESYCRALAETGESFGTWLSKIED